MATPVEHFQKLIEEAADLIVQTGPFTDERFLAAHHKIEQVLTVDRDNPGIVFLLGSLYMRAGRYAMAEHFLRRCIDMAPKHGEAWNNLGVVLQSEGRREESVAAFEKALECSPGIAEVLNNIATGYVNNGTPDKVLEICKKALDLDPDALDPKWNRSLAYLEKGDYRRGWQEYDVGLDLADSARSSTQRKVRNYPTPDGKPLPYWDGTPGQKVVIYGEQGVGDEIMAMSMLPDAMERADIVYEAHPRLVNIARAAFGDRIPIYGTRKVSAEGLAMVQWHRFDARLPVLGLGKLFRNEAADFPRAPYLKPFDEAVGHSQSLLDALGDKLKVGISWKGGSITTRNDLRSIPLEDWLPLLKGLSDRVSWVSLQYDPPDKPGLNEVVVARFNEEAGEDLLHHNTSLVNDLDYCYGGLIHALDLVVSINTSLVHACGAMGVKCWTLTPSRPAWRYGLTSEHMDWYGDHVRQIRQKDDDWGPVLKRVERDLEALINEKREAA